MICLQESSVQDRGNRTVEGVVIVHRKVILHVPYDWGKLESGSRVIPYKIYNAFLEAGYEVFLLSGKVTDRWQRFKTLIKSREAAQSAFCFSVPSSYPVHPFLDYAIYIYLRLKGIPIGVDYTDAYWKFQDYFRKRGLRKLTLILRYKIDLFIFNRVASAIFFQSQSFSELFDIKCKKVIFLPGGEVKERPYRQKAGRQSFTGIYVGGISKRYGLSILLNAFNQVNKTKRVNLIIVCRKDEFREEAHEFAPFLGKEWLSVHHVSGHGLDAVYRQVDFAIIPLEADEYNNMIMNVKLFEYLSFQLPMVVTNCREVAKFVTENKIGLVCEDNPESLAKAILTLASSEELYNSFSLNAYNTLVSRNLWVHRIETIEETLGESKNMA